MKSPCSSCGVARIRPFLMELCAAVTSHHPLCVCAACPACQPCAAPFLIHSGLPFARRRDGPWASRFKAGKTSAGTAHSGRNISSSATASRSSPILRMSALISSPLPGSFPGWSTNSFLKERCYRPCSNVAPFSTSSPQSTSPCLPYSWSCGRYAPIRPSAWHMP